MTAYAYLRVSTDQQAESKLGLLAQRDACERAYTIAAVYADEGVSGKTGLDRRPALLEAISALDKGDLLVVAKRDRLGRDPMVVAMIEAAVKRKGARIISVAGEGTESDSPTDILMRRMVDAFAEYERLIIAARTKAALQAKKSRGERVGSIQYGYRLSGDGKTLVEDEQEQQAIKLINELHARGLSLRNIASRLEARGLRPRGDKWYPQTISNILKVAQ